jgi:hypothetical protein
VQLIEVSVTGVRSAVITLRRESTPMAFELFSMVHLGTSAYYQAVTERLRDCQLIVAEGVSGWSPTTRALTLAYRLPGRSRRLGLTVQSIDYAALGIPVIRPDLTARQLARRWRAVPLLQRLAVWCLLPPVALAVRIFGTRRFMARHLSRDDLPTPEDHMARSVAGEIMEVIVDHRDELLLEALASVHEARCGEPVTVAVVYGAEHVPAVAHTLLARYGYRPRAAEWLTVFDF